MRSVDFNLYLITDRTQTGGRPLLEVVRKALAGGVRAVQLREKDLSPRELYTLAAELRRATLDYDAQLFINDRLDLAQAVGADGVHLGAGSLPVDVVRRLAGRGMLIGYSAHAAEEACRAAVKGADFVTCGPIYPTPSKAAHGDPLGLKILIDASRRTSVPIFALGGITVERTPEVLAAGARGVAMIAAVVAAADPGLAAATLLETIKKHAQPA